MRARLGDVIDDYCVKCKRIMNHSVVSCLNDEPAKVRCRTCHGDHDYRHEQAPPTKADLRKAALFKEVLDRMGPSSPEETPESAETAAEAPAETVPPGKGKRLKARK
jgi:hypothetical protein